MVKSTRYLPIHTDTENLSRDFENLTFATYS
jgi:hypothetical protein